MYSRPNVYPNYVICGILKYVCCIPLLTAFKECDLPHTKLFKAIVVSCLYLGNDAMQFIISAQWECAIC